MLHIAVGLENAFWELSDRRLSGKQTNKVYKKDDPNGNPPSPAHPVLLIILHVPCQQMAQLQTMVLPKQQLYRKAFATK